MRLLTAGGLAALACAAAIAACSDQPDGNRAVPTEPIASSRIKLADGALLRVHGAGSISVRGPNGLVAHPIPDWSTVGTMRGGVARDEAAASPLGIVAVAAATRGTIPAAGGARFSEFTDDQGNRIVVAFLFAPDGGPLRSTRYFVNGELRMVSDLRWTAVRGGWMLQASKRRVFRGGQPVGEVRGVASPAGVVASRAPGADLLTHLALAAARALAPQDANAQLLSGPCRKEWLDYVAAQAALSAAIIAFETNPNAVTAALVIAASAHATAVEMELWICEENDAARHQPNGGGRGAGGGLDCMADFFSPGCSDLPPDAL